MARIRSIKVDLFVDDSLADVSLEAHFLLAGLPVLADRAGRLEDRPRRIQAQIFPYRPGVDVEACLAELARSGHIVRYTTDTGTYIQIEGWEVDQRPHVKEAPSVIPPPSGRGATPAPSSSVVYFVQAAVSRLIKIGYTTNLTARLSALQTGSAEPLRLIGSVPGDARTEKALHARFEALRRDGEWFADDPSISSFLAEAETLHRAPASSRRVPGGNTGESAGIMDSGSGVLDLGSGVLDPGIPLRGQAVLAGIPESVGKGGRKKSEAKPDESREAIGGPVHQLRQQYADVWAAAGRRELLGLPVKRSVRDGENPVDFSREGQLWQQALNHARVAGAADDAAAVALVLERLKHAAYLLKSVNEGGTWVSRPKVLTLAEFVTAFHEAAEDPRQRRAQPSIHSTAVSDWSEERKKHGEDGWTPSDAEVVQAMEQAKRGAGR